MDRLGINIIAGALLVSVPAAALASGPTTGPGNGRLSTQEAALLDKRLKGGLQPRLSIAMSGGGLRSSLFNIGVLKALYDQGVLDQADVISSVSGGSYANYWLFTNELAHPGDRFGEYSLSDENFPQRMCELVTTSNFVTYGRVVNNLPGLGPAWRKMYRNALIRTYGKSEQHRSPVNIGDLAKPVEESGTIPYPIINASIVGRDDRPWAEQMFEFTPVHYGTPSVEVHAWDNQRYPMSMAVAASGAAVGPLSRTFAFKGRHHSSSQSIKLWDGGKTENLGAAAPLIRGTRRLIVIDAQLDPPHKPFEAYVRLKERLAPLGYTVTATEDSRDLGEFKSRFRGSVTRGDQVSELDYIKMRVPTALRREILASSKAIEDGARVDSTFYKTLEDSASGLRRNWDCASVSSFSTQMGETTMRSWLLAVTAAYMDWSDGSGNWRLIHRMQPDQREFPQYTTADQSFFRDQTQAYIGLGYLVASQQIVPSDSAAATTQ